MSLNVHLIDITSPVILGLRCNVEILGILEVFGVRDYASLRKQMGTVEFYCVSLYNAKLKSL